MSLIEAAKNFSQLASEEEIDVTKQYRVTIRLGTNLPLTPKQTILVHEPHTKMELLF